MDSTVTSTVAIATTTPMSCTTVSLVTFFLSGGFGRYTKSVCIMT